jgi:beta-1,4-mannosyl-glycoprotein beta-1,4-N-acetylglucosaminyltransferase
MLIDCFMFYNESDVLEARLTLLEDYVDLFVLVESEVTHLGSKKKLYFEPERFKKWNIKHVIAKDMPTDDDPWTREKYQRQCILEGLVDVPGESIVMISDVDEIPDMRLVPFEKMPHNTISLHMHMFEYSFRYYFDIEPWVGTTVTTVALLKNYGPNYFRDNRWKFPIIQNAGWHMSSFGDWEHVYNKFSTYVHALDEGTPKDPEVYRKNVQEGLWHGKKLKTPPVEAIPPLPENIFTKFI